MVRDAAGYLILLTCYAFAFSTMCSTMIARQSSSVVVATLYSSVQQIGTGIVESVLESLRRALILSLIYHRRH